MGTADVDVHKLRSWPNGRPGSERNKPPGQEALAAVDDDFDDESDDAEPFDDLAEPSEEEELEVEDLPLDEESDVVLLDESLAPLVPARLSVR